MTDAINEASISGCTGVPTKNNVSNSKHVGNAGRCAGPAMYKDVVAPSPSDTDGLLNAVPRKHGGDEMAQFPVPEQTPEVHRFFFVSRTEKMEDESKPC